MVAKNTPFYDEEALKEKRKQFSSEKLALLRERDLLTRRLAEFDATTRKLNNDAQLKALSAICATASASTGPVKEDPTCRALELKLLNKELVQRQPDVEREVMQWEQRRKASKQALAAAVARLRAVPKRFLQTVEDVRAEGRALRDALAIRQAEAQETEMRAMERAQAAADEADCAKVELEEVLCELAAAEVDRDKWVAKERMSKAQTQAIAAQRDGLRASLAEAHGPRAYARVAFRLAARGVDRAPVSRVAECIRPFFASELDIDDATIARAQTAKGVSVQADASGSGLTWAEFDMVVASIEELASAGHNATAAVGG